MMQSPEHSKPPFDRRRFIGDTIKLAVLAGIISPFEQACKSKSSQEKSTTKDTSNAKNKGTSHTAKRVSKRRKWNQEKLIVNTTTNVVHLPTAVVYNYYDEIKHTRDLNMGNWENQVLGELKWNKDKSGNIIEVLSLQKLRSEVNDNTLNNAINALSKAFGKECENKTGKNNNTTNYRLHELMLQLVALNSTIQDKWNAFNEKVKKPNKIGKRQKWMETETNFNVRVKYIQDREADYKKRLSQRASKYSLT
jgi:hypothetical protein